MKHTKKFRTTTVQKEEMIKMYGSHQGLYKALGLESWEAYHGNDRDFSSNCDGFALFIAKYPLLISRVTSQVEIEVMHTKEVLPLLLIAAQYTFQKLGLQAERGIHTEVTEQLLLQLKEAIAAVQQYQYCFLQPLNVVENSIEWSVTRHSPLYILQKVKGISYLITTEEEIIDYLSIRIAEVKLFFFNPPEKEMFLLLPLPILKWTGKELVAIHTENIPSNLLEKGLIQIEHRPS